MQISYELLQTSFIVMFLNAELTKVVILLQLASEALQKIELEHLSEHLSVSGLHS